MDLSSGLLTELFLGDQQVGCISCALWPRAVAACSWPLNQAECWGTERRYVITYGNTQLASVPQTICLSRYGQTDCLLMPLFLWAIYIFPQSFLPFFLSFFLPLFLFLSRKQLALLDVLCLAAAVIHKVGNHSKTESDSTCSAWLGRGPNGWFSLIWSLIFYLSINLTRPC